MYFKCYRINKQVLITSKCSNIKEQRIYFIQIGVKTTFVYFMQAVNVTKIYNEAKLLLNWNLVCIGKYFILSAC